MYNNMNPYSVIQNSFTALKLPCAFAYSSLLFPESLGNTHLFTVSVAVAFHGMSYSWNHTGCSLCILASFTVICIYVSFVSFCDLTAHFFLLLNIILLYGCSMVYVFIHSLVEVHFACF